MYGTVLGGLLYGVGLPLCVTLAGDYGSFGGGGGGG